MQLPVRFEEKMKDLLGGEYPAFLKSYEEDPHQALRVNTCKIDVEEFKRRSPFTLRSVPWTKTGFYYERGERPGKHPWHDAGLYYMQEPSAMAVAELAEAKPGEKILDLCAAPGGKTTQLASAMEGKGLLVANEIHPARAKILSSNVERMGIGHAVVTNESPERLSARFPLFFDKIVADAPCSGEGMFRKEEQALAQWSPENVEMCAGRQQDILDEAAKMLRPGGRLIYSTCTFAPEEDEGSVRTFLERHPEFSVEKVKAYEGFSPGRPEWTGEGGEAFGIENTFRLWPHKLEGEGHYAAVLRKKGEQDREPSEKEETVRKKRRPAGEEVEAWKLWKEFASENLLREPEGEPVLFGDQLFLLPCALNLAGLKVVRAGLHLGEIKKKRFEPSHAMALYLRQEDARRMYCLNAEAGETEAFLRGESISREAEKGWTLVLTDGFPLAWGKQAGGQLKNHYPKGLRRM